jgi:hypothetical protein
VDPRGSRRSHGRVGRKRLTTGIAALAAVVGLLVATSVALAAGGSTCQQYNPQTCNVVTPPTSTVPPPTSTVPPPATGSTPPTAPTTTSTSPTPTTPTLSSSPGTPPPTLVTATSPTTTAAPAVLSKSTLPFTGLDLGLIVAAGLVLIAGGFVVRRMTRRLN